MAQSSSAVEDYTNLRRASRWRQPPEQRAELVRKSFAQQLARSASQIVEDRRKRAEVKAELYAHLLPLLESHDREQNASRKLYQKVILILSAALAASFGLLALTFLF